jgi:N6-adenosine-specific RNA methylase IME4
LKKPPPGRQPRRTAPNAELRANLARSQERRQSITTKKFNIIYADPPWRYANKGGQGVAENHYPTMSCDEICALPVAELAAKDSALFLWATFPQLPEALRVISAWGFGFKTVAFVWLKQNRKAKTWFYGMGFWTRSNAEVCLLATRGHPKRQDKGIHQFIISPVEAHSKKPDETRNRIVRLMGDLPRVELFARQSPPGWDVWGNEVANTIAL